MLRPKYFVYVAEARNGDLYVGSTCGTGSKYLPAVRHRASQHRARGKLAARLFKRHGFKRLVLELCPIHEVYPTRPAAERAERGLANRLRRQLKGRVVHQH